VKGGVGAALALALVFGELPFGLTIIWALIAIGINQSNRQVIAAVISLATLVAIGLACALILGIAAPPPPPEDSGDKLRLHVIRDYFRRKVSPGFPLKEVPEIIHSV
jgi:hypothetical protein